MAKYTWEAEQAVGNKASDGSVPGTGPQGLAGAPNPQTVGQGLAGGVSGEQAVQTGAIDQNAAQVAGAQPAAAAQFKVGDTVRLKAKDGQAKSPTTFIINAVDVDDSGNYTYSGKVNSKGASKGGAMSGAEADLELAD